MIIEVVIIFLASLNDGWIIFDACHVIKKGKYYAPATPGTWSKIIVSVGINPFSIGPFFVAFDLLWFISTIGVATKCIGDG